MDAAKLEKNKFTSSQEISVIVLRKLFRDQGCQWDLKSNMLEGIWSVETGKDGWGIMSLGRLEDKCKKDCKVCSKCSLSCVEKFGVKCIQDIACEDAPDCDNDDDIIHHGHWI